MSTAALRARYLAGLRRSLLLRIHPDLHRSAPAAAANTAFVSALGNRLDSPDVKDWQKDRLSQHQYYRTRKKELLEVHVLSSSETATTATVDLRQPPSKLFASLAELAGFSQPVPKSRAPPSSPSPSGAADHSMGGFRPPPPFDREPTSTTSTSLPHFLSTLSPEALSYTLAHCARARKSGGLLLSLSSFETLDVSRLNFSAENTARVLDRINMTLVEYAATLPVFAGLHLVLSSDDNRNVVDEFAGHIFLNPSATPLQWLGTLGRITPPLMRRIGENRKENARDLDNIRGCINARVVRGFTCSPESFFYFCRELSRNLTESPPGGSALVRRPLTIVVESEDWRSMKLLRSGRVQISAAADYERLAAALPGLRADAERLADEEEGVKEANKELAESVRRAIRLRSAPRVLSGHSGVTAGDAGEMLGRLLDFAEGAGRAEDLGILEGQALILTSRRFFKLDQEARIHVPYGFSTEPL